MRTEPFGTLEAPLARVEFRGDAARGHRLVGPIVGARIDGPHLAATQEGRSGADWLIMGGDGTVIVDVRLSLRTDDGAALQLAYSGRADWNDGIGSGPVFSAFRFDSDDARYRWLSTRLIVGRGTVEPTRGSYSLDLLA